ncbi:SusD/RagB family nutrient-binding outer membrane lipoprotein [Parabacteroides chinchillae]|uniref:Starch-binding associating with outer membrane n=1 Tax=Parabacteroides chinchillae TaxID=871327 RepID=A0A8G2FBE3_9BACT|nr:SusD/RagB family nutrient-binding outer membrane lipoprotein [Parabacteroides chinchillae]SEG04587.1 Starch-binding associating with outer membrane [Parabacteroides chinchillae]
MKRNKIAERLFAFALITLPLVSCTEDTMDKINADKNHPQTVSSKFIMTDVMTSTALNAVGGDFSTYASIYMEHEVGIDNQTYNAEIRSGEPNLAATYNNMWGAVYQNIRDIKDVIAKCSEGGIEEGNDVTLGIAKVLYAYNYALMTDLFGDIPFKEACEYTDQGTPLYMQPAIDKQEEIYKEIMQNLDDAFVLLNGTDAAATGSMGMQDLIYGKASNGKIDAEKALWQKAVYGLKARYTMRLLSKSANPTQTLNEVLDYISKSFTSSREEMKFAVYDGNNQLNPLFDFMYSRAGLGASQSLIKKMMDRKDPRLAQSFATSWNYNYGQPMEQATDPAKIFAAPNGNPVQGTMNYDCSLADWAITAPTQLLSYHELLFIKAEALCRLKKNTEAEAALKEAIAVGFANTAIALESSIYDWGIEGEVDLSADVADAYFADNVKPLFDANPLKETMVQKYLAFFGASGEAVEAYNDYRRMKAMGENFVELANPNNQTKFPLRYTYGSSDVLSNLNIKEAFGNGQYVYSEPVWWAGGSR